MATHYSHTQPGYVILITLALVCVAGVYVALAEGIDPAGIIALVIVMAILALFCTLTVQIDEDALEIRFGPGIIRKRFRLKNIDSCRAVKNRWYCGWGIHMIPGGWLYNVSGWHAVEIELKSGRKHRIGTDVPEDLRRAILDALKDMPG